MNKFAGKFREERLKEALSSLSEHHPEVLETSGPGDATRLSAEVGDGSYLVVYGGDGTINEVAQSVVNRDIVMVPLNAGTGSDFQKTIGSLSSSEISKAVQEGLRSKIDAIRVSFPNGTRYFVNIMEVGLGARVMERVNRRQKTMLDPFTSAVLHEIGSVRNYSFKMHADDYSSEISTPEIVVANCRYFGGGMLASPNSDPSDGKLEIHAIQQMNKVSLLMNLRKLRTGRYIQLPNVVNLTTKSLILEGDEAPIEMDGEVIGHTPLKAEVVEGGINVLGRISLQRSS